MFYRALSDEHTRRVRRARPVIALAAVAFAIGVIVGANGGSSPADSLAERFVTQWSRDQYGAMYGEIDAASRRSLSADEFASAYHAAMNTATATHLRVLGKAHAAPDGFVAVPVRVSTRLFGSLTLNVEVQTADGGEGAKAIAWSRSLTFPGMLAGEQLTRQTTLPDRAKLLARDGSVLAEGSAEAAGPRSSPLGESASAVIGEVGAIPGSERTALESEGVPTDAIVGTSGLERALDTRLRGTPGGELLAGHRVLATAAPHAAHSVRTSISPTVQKAAVEALGSRLGGIVALQPSTGQVLAVAGIALNSVQPPGSTFKMVTLTGALEAHVATPRTTYPYATFATLDGVKLSNANGEECGGSLALAFAVSCNSVFAPLGVKLGAPRLVALAERFGFNHSTGIEGAAESTLPSASEIQGELDVGSTAIGQGQVQASALQMAIVAATIADGGHRPQPTFTLAHPPPGPTVTSTDVARTVRRLMIGVVKDGTGTSAAIPGVTVAGKTGTAELKSECSNSGEAESSEESSSQESSSGGCVGADSEASNTDAWFASFAPALRPRIVVGVLLVKDGAGGDTAAPVAREVLEAGLQASR
ncbi:MAG TPA: penicillin-binding transpeptidase domain-containing protein [Solirubrobacteraceae bacterium]|jgi:peptidoglycan glycosyltransferase|nr:penicillin-binding transpeptidase domain-containing protein [Solirubrobacteraceae bacterium]